MGVSALRSQLGTSPLDIDDAVVQVENYRRMKRDLDRSGLSAAEIGLLNTNLSRFAPRLQMIASKYPELADDIAALALPGKGPVD